MQPQFKSHFCLMTTYNARMNEQVYKAASILSEQQLKKDVGAFFKSVFGTLNHILTGDLLWLERFQSHPANYSILSSAQEFPRFESLDQIAYSNFDELYRARKKLDALIARWINDEISEADFGHSISYSDTRGNTYKRNFAELLSHFFNHQTHHRGQVSTLLSQSGIDIGITDFLIDIPSSS